MLSPFPSGKHESENGYLPVRSLYAMTPMENISDARE
eukprot:CAMPEP_0169304154 /NCGR_PEP_ID=MMETSP1016-20121227/69735_1 /TAXON_ID=342587 /ORGANISM="Karlodinium micrum, Strain CCMP2283" /LENGTH=36 /DNA_ID= /DNA_START= /DNA_END= /DNA_ORIENTATION=